MMSREFSVVEWNISVSLKIQYQSIDPPLIFCRSIMQRHTKTAVHYKRLKKEVVYLYSLYSTINFIETNTGKIMFPPKSMLQQGGIPQGGAGVRGLLIMVVNKGFDIHSMEIRVT